MHFVRIRIREIPPFTGSVEFKLDEQVNLFVGPNASGKSTVLLTLADELIGKEEKPKKPIGEGSNRVHTMVIPDAEVDDEWARELASSDRLCVLTTSLDRDDVRSPQDYMPVIYIGSVREGLPGVSGAKELEDCDNAAEEILEEQFSGASTIIVCNFLAKEIWDDDNDAFPKYARATLRQAIVLADTCSKSICDEVVKDSNTHNYIPGPDIRGYLHHPHAPSNTIEVLRMMAINTNDIRNFDHLSVQEEPSYAAYHEDPSEIPLYLGHLSSGTEGTLLWIRWLALKMLHHYEFKEGWEKRPAILLIDEIENHLHPTWQRRVIPALLEHFPGLQIFATTHSPFVVAGLRAGQVHMLKRDAGGVVTASTNERDIIGWTTDEILRTFMGVDEPTDQLTIDRYRRLRELRGKESMTEAEAAEMEELRRQVNEDFLSSSTPLEAQRERYGEMMLEFLRSRQSELSQDGD